MSALFEHSPWVEARADARPPSGARHADLMAVVHEASPEEQIDLIRAHPELAGKASLDRTLTEASAAEQASAGLDRLTAEEFDRFHALNAAYVRTFGFPFIICVRLTDKAGILSAMESRLANTRARESEIAIEQIGEIVRLRLADLGLAELEARIARDLAYLNYGEPDWLVPRAHPDGHVYDAVIVGGGQSGLGAAFGLKLARIANILVIDESPAGLEGPWDTYARMRTLRTPKHLTAIDMGLPSLTFRAWFEAQHGSAAWDALGKIPRRQWMAYLRWYRRVLDLPVRNDIRLDLIEPLDGLYKLHLADGSVLIARKLILATGIQGGGHWHTPDMVKSLPRDRYAHTSEPIDYAALAGKRIGILGGGASAFDNASTALDAGVARAEVFIRRSELPRVNVIRFMEGAGMIQRYPALDDAAKYDVMASFWTRNQPPTTDMFERAAANDGFDLHLGSPWLSVDETADGVRVTTPHATYLFDFLVLSTGLITDPALRPELRLVQDRIARWGDRFAPPAALANPVIDAHPYLGPAFEFLPRAPEDAAALHGLFAFNYSALVSLGLSAAALSGLKHALPRLVSGVADQLFRDDGQAILADYHAYAELEFVAEWPRADHSPAREAAE
ncbi:FAD-dependent urate hydroxylase HpyO [soil metagenome]